MYAADDDALVSDSFVDSINYLRKVSPEKFEMWPIPPLWRRGVDLDQHIDVPMHLLFLGVVKTCIRTVQSWCTLRGKSNELTGHLNLLLDPIQQLSLSWMPVIPYSGGKLGGWISENYVALAKISPWFYSQITSIGKDFEYVEPTGAQKTWNRDQNFSWLRARDLHHGKGKWKANKLQAEVKLLLESNCPPSVKQNIGGDVGNAQSMICSLYHFIADCM